MKQSPMYQKPTEKQRMQITAARKRMREGMEGEKDFVSRFSTTMAKGARDEQKMAMRDMEKVPESVRRYEMEEGQTATPYKKGGMVSKKKSGGNVMRGCGAAVKGKGFKGVF